MDVEILGKDMKRLLKKEIWESNKDLYKVIKPNDKVIVEKRDLK